MTIVENEDSVPNVWRCGFCNHIEGKYYQQPRGVTSDGQYFICLHCLTIKENGNTMVVERNTNRESCSDHPQCVVKNEMYGIIMKINSSYQRQWLTIFLKYLNDLPNYGYCVSNWNSKSETGKQTLVKNIIDRIEEEKKRKIRQEEEERRRIDRRKKKGKKNSTGKRRKAKKNSTGRRERKENTKEKEEKEKNYITL